MIEGIKTEEPSNYSDRPDEPDLDVHLATEVSNTGSKYDFVILWFGIVIGATVTLLIQQLV